MTEQEPKQTIIEYLSRPLGVLQPSSPPPAGVDQSTWHPGEARSGGGLGAKATTICFFQDRQRPGRQLHEVAFENETGQQEHWLCCVREFTPGHWRFVGGGNVAEVEHTPKRSHPWANLAGSLGKEVAWAGGRVLDNGLDVVLVRLTSENGVMLEDTVQNSLVLFVTDQWLERPLHVELYDRSGNLVGTHQAFSLRPSPQQR